MIVLELESVEIDYCLSCSGIWLDAGELELLLGNSSGQKTLLASLAVVTNIPKHNRFANLECFNPGCLGIILLSLIRKFGWKQYIKEKKRKCPICRKPMQKVNCGTAQKILLDKCSAHHGLWFDRGELENILRDGRLDSDGKIFTLLRKMFAQTLTPSQKGD